MPTVPHLCKKLKPGANYYGRCLLGLFLIGMLWFTGEAQQARAKAVSQVRPLSASPEQLVASDTGPDSTCLMCHADPDFKGSFQNGELFSLHVDSGEYYQSVHGPAGLHCVACHTDNNRYPHHAEEQITCIECHPAEGGQDDTPYATLRVQLSFANHREMTLIINETCRSCHEAEFMVVGDSSHVRVRRRGNLDAPVCVDCHGSHNVTWVDNPRVDISQRCGTCHGATYSTYRTSVHGAALENESNPDVPTCTDCHGAHYIPSPKTAVFRAKSPQLCAGCHANEQIMAKYGLSAQVFETYIADFHGTTLQLLEPKPDTSPREAVCFDCHGVHDIRRTGDPETGIGIKENLLETCRQCHSGVTINFPDAWLSHYEPSPKEAAWVYYTEKFFAILTVSVISALMGHIVLDFGRLVIKKIISGGAPT